MSTESTDNTLQQRDHKVVNLYTGQIEAFQDAKATLEEKIGEDLTEGQAVAVVCAWYLQDQDLPEVLEDMVDETAAENDDPVFTYGEIEALQRIDPDLPRRMAATANTDEVSGRSTKLERYSYFVER